MEINWTAVLTGFLVALAIAIVAAFAVPISGATVWMLALPGLIGGFVAGYMVLGGWEGAVHGGLATIIGALIWLAFVTVWGLFFVGIFPALGAATVILFALFVQAIPGALAGALGGWIKERQATRSGTAAS
jgi:hypothetical protein